MADMNKSHFATMLESIKEDHMAALGAHTKEAEEKVEAIRLEHDAMSERARRDVETAKAELEVSEPHQLELIGRSREPSARH
jgi:hypothetical protein